MKYAVPIILTATLMPAFGQERTGGAIDPGDIWNFLIQSQIVGFKPNVSRDPFAVASEKTAQNQDEMLIDDVTIVGRLVIKNKTYAVIQDSNQNVKQLPVGHRFQDGEITAITETSVVFSQWDPSLGSQSGRRPVTKVFKNENL